MLAVSDEAAVGAYRAAHERGPRVPQAISIAVFDDIDVGRALNAPLTTVHVPGDEMGRMGFERLRYRIEGKETGLSPQIKWTIPTSLVVRGSVTPPRTGR